MIFYKICQSEGPHKDLPSVQWDPGTQKPKFEFTPTGVRGVLKFQTDDPELITMLRRAGYYEEMPQGLGNVNRMGLAGELSPEEHEALPKAQVTPETASALNRRKK
jgi:hypothetical protein